MDIPHKVYETVIRRRKMVCAEIPLPAGSTRRAWIGIYPLPFKQTFNVRYFEVESHFIDSNDDLGESSLLNQEWYKDVTPDALWIVLSKWLDDFNELILPYRSDYPI